MRQVLIHNKQNACTVENERTGELSSPYLRFCCTTWGHFSKFNNSKVVGDIKMLLSSHKNLGKWWTFRVGFKCLCSLCSKWQHFEKKRAKIRFSALANKAIFGKASKTTQLWPSAVTKPLQLQKFWAYPWKGNIHIFHLAPSFLKSSHRYSCDDFLKKVASSGTIQKSRNISSSFVLYGSAQYKWILSMRDHYFTLLKELRSSAFAMQSQSRKIIYCGTIN